LANQHPEEGKKHFGGNLFAPAHLHLSFWAHSAGHLAKLPLSFSFFFFLTIYSHLFADFYFDFISAFGILLTPFATPPDRRGQPFPVIITMTLMPEDISLLLGPDHKRPNERLSVVMFFSPLQA